MKRTRNHFNVPNHYPAPKRKYDPIENAFLKRTTKSFTELAEHLKGSLSMRQCQLLLLKLNLEIQNKNCPYPLKFKNSLFRLASIAFTNIEQIINRRSEEFYTFIDEQEDLDTRKNRPGQSLAFILYNLGQLADAKESPLTKTPLFPGLPQFSASNLQYLLEIFARLPQQTAKAIGNSFHGIGVLAKAGKLQRGVAAATLQELLTKLLSRSDIDPHAISNSLNGLGMLAQAGTLQGQIATATLQLLLNKLLSLPESTPLNNSASLYGLGLLAKSHSLRGILSDSLLHLLIRLNAGNPESNHARQALKGITALFGQKETLLSRSLAEQIKSLIHIATSSSYLHPTQAADLINCIVLLKEYHAEFQQLFITLVEALGVTLLYFNSTLQTQLLENVRHLASVPPWQQTLQQQLGLEQPVDVEHSSRRVAVYSETQHHEVPETHVAQGPPSRPREDVTQPTTTLRRSTIDPQWTVACRNNVFNAIFQKNEKQLRSLLHLFAEPTTRKPRDSSQAMPRGNAFFPRTPSLPKDRGPGQAGDLVTSFFTTTPATALRRLVTESESRFFYLLLHACSRHVRYQLAQTNALHPVILYLPQRELTSLVDSLLSLELYRDHQAILHLIDALVIRCEQNPQEQALIIEAQNSLLQRALTFHRQAKHTHVTASLEVVKTGLDSQTSNPLETPALPQRRPCPATQAPAPAPLPVASSESLNCKYEYSSEDIQAILASRLKNDYPLAHILAGALMNEHTFGNRVVDVLNDYVAQNPRSANEREILLLPIEIGAHWVGLSITRMGNDITALTYFNSKKNLDRDVPLMRTIKNELRRANLVKSDLPIAGAHAAMQQPQEDSQSCGIYLVENFYCSLKNQWWANPNNTPKTAMAMRQRHLEVLTQHRPDYVHNFLEHQALAAPILPNLTLRQQSHGVSSSQSAFFVNASGCLHESNRAVSNPCSVILPNQF